jgi:hypothetical protein
MALKDYILLTFGLIGTILGIINLVREIRKNIPKIVIQPYPAIKHKKDVLNLIYDIETFKQLVTNNHFPTDVALRIINNGKVPIYISWVGFFNPKTPFIERFYIIPHEKLPKKVDASEMWYFSTSLTENLRTHLSRGGDKMFVEYGIGKIAQGTTDSFVYLIKELKKINNP